MEKMVKGKTLRKVLEYRYIYLLLLPGVLYYILFSYMPLYGVSLAFKQFMLNKSIASSPWIGMENFRKLFADDRFFRAFSNTIQISFGRILFEFPVPIVLAVFLNEIKWGKFKRVVQSTMYFPYFISWVIMYTIIYNVFSVDTGSLNQLLAAMGQDKINFLSNVNFFRPLLYLTNVWKTAGYSVIMYLGVITTIDPQLYEAAYIDGASRMRAIWHVTLPGMKTIILTLFILCVSNMMNGGFDQIFNLHRPAVYSVSEIIDTYIYTIGILKAEFSLTTAAGLFKSLINLTLLLIVDTISRKLNNVGLYM